MDPLASPSAAAAPVAPAEGAGRRTLGRAARGFARESRGSVAVVFAMTLLLLCMFIGAAVDFARWLNARHQTMAALDAAVLAGGRLLQYDENDVAGAKEAAQRYYTENTKARAEVVDEAISFDVVDDATAFSGTSTAYVKTAFLGVANIPRLPLNTFAKARLKTDPVEISLMLDVTGSMSGTKITDLKAAAKDLVEIVMTHNGNIDDVRIAMVPFAEGVRLPSYANAAARGADPGPSFTVKVGKKTYTYEKTECVVERKGAERYTDAAPGSDTYVMTLFNTTYSTYTKGKCGLSAKDELVPLTTDKELLKSRIQSLELSGSTAGQIGTAWAWYTLSPNWNTLWPADRQASAYNTETRKIAILMTDGEYNLASDSRGVQEGMPGAGSPVNADSTTQARAICQNMKDKGILVYTVGFALGKNATAIATMNKCATNASTAYKAENGAQLKQAFRDIALKIANLYLTQ